ncbi:MAG: protein translocase subunit SecD [Legionellaceae bacterium]|nr:protein translocase subunit SecD [Legionellaceae bacterium]
MSQSRSVWKNLLLIGTVVVGFIYAIPNIFSEYPIVQISSQQPADLSSVQAQIQTLLHEANVPYQNMREENEVISIRFDATDRQLEARDLIKDALGNDFTVALNLAPATPAWLRHLGAEPMKQGLDLRGGVHFLLEIDMDSVLRRRFEGLMKNISQTLRTHHLRYQTISFHAPQAIQVIFREPALTQEALSLLEEDFQSSMLHVDKNTLTLTLSDQEIHSIKQNTIDQTMGILRKRVNELGVGEAIVQQQGATRVAVDLPGIQDAARAKQILGGTATLAFHMVDQTHDPVLVQKTGAIPLQSKLYMMDNRPILLQRPVVLSGDSITSAVSSYDQQTASPAVLIQLGGGGERLFSQVTRDNIGKRMAIVYVETKTTQDSHGKRVTQRSERVISAPVIQGALGNSFQITGLSDLKEAGDLSLLLRAGALPAAIYPIEERTVGPSLGKENIRRGVVSLEVGMGLIILLMLVYYEFFGLIANIGLLLNLIFLAALLSILGATLTLPGIAGIVLTVGMAVDANVLIYERIREELRHGMNPQAAIYAGYERAFATILDANLTTLIVGIILFSIGSGPIRGFAITLCLGLLTSMLTSITYTRALVQAWYGKKPISHLSIGI